MTKDQQEKKKAARTAVAARGQRPKDWPSEHDVSLQLSKVLCDCALLSKVSLLDKRILNVSCSGLVDEAFWVNKVWVPCQKLVGVITLIKSDESGSTKST